MGLMNQPAKPPARGGMHLAPSALPVQGGGQAPQASALPSHQWFQLKGLPGLHRGPGSSGVTAQLGNPANKNKLAPTAIDSESTDGTKKAGIGMI